MASRLLELDNRLSQNLTTLKQTGLYKDERIISSPQSANVIANGKPVLNFCANNYLGLSSHPRIIEAAKRYLNSHGFGMSSVRFICGTQDIHKELEKQIASFYQKEACILFPSGFDANAGFFEALFDKDDAVISDSLNHASIIDGIRLCKAKKLKYDHLDMNMLESCLKETQNCRSRLVVTDGVFSMDGDIAPLDKIYELVSRYSAYLFIDQCHATGVIGKNGKGTPQLFGLEGKIDFISSTLGKAMGGASGGFVAASAPVVDMLRNKARTYLFSNSVAPCLVGASLEAFKLLAQNKEALVRLQQNTALFRSKMKANGFQILGHHTCPIAPVFLADAVVASKMSKRLMEEGIFAVGFSFPVVPKGKARIRVQLSATQTKADVETLVRAFKKIGQQMGIV